MQGGAGCLATAEWGGAQRTMGRDGPVLPANHSFRLGGGGEGLIGKMAPVSVLHLSGAPEEQWPLDLQPSPWLHKTRSPLYVFAPPNLLTLPRPPGGVSVSECVCVRRHFKETSGFSGSFHLTPGGQSPHWFLQPGFVRTPLPGTGALGWGPSFLQGGLCSRALSPPPTQLPGVGAGPGSCLRPSYWS